MPARSGFLGGGSLNPGGGGAPTALEARVAALETTPPLPARVTTLEGNRALQSGLDAAIARIVALEGTSSAAVEPNIADAKPISQLGLTGIDWYSASDPYINHHLNNGSPNLRISGVGDGTAAQIIASQVLHPQTLLPTTFLGQAGITFGDAIVGQERHGASVYPDDFNNDTWVLEAVGADKLFMVPQGSGVRTETVTQANRREFTYVGCEERQPIFLNSTDAAFAAGGLKFYRKSDEVRLLAGKTFRKRFVDLCARHKVIRVMDWMSININAARSIDGIKTKSVSFRGRPEKVEFYSRSNMPVNGVPAEELFELATEANSALWYNVPVFIGAGEGLCDVLEQTYTDYDANILEGYKNYATANLTAIVASNEWSRYTDHIIQKMVAANYPKTRVFYLEWNNEPWNTAFSAHNLYCRGASVALGLPDSFAAGYGYISAKLAHAFALSLAAAGRADQEWRICFNVQNVRTVENSLVRQGFERYFSDRSIDLAPYKAKAGGAIAPYIEGCYDYTIGAVPGAPFTDFALYTTAFTNAIQTNPNGLMNAMRDWLVPGADTPEKFGSVAHIAARVAEHREDWAASGYKFIGCYEGGNGWGLYPQHTQNGVIMPWHNAFSVSSQAGEVTTAYINALKAIDPNMVIANFVDVGFGAAADVYQPAWLDDYWDQLTDGAWGAWQPFLRPAP